MEPFAQDLNEPADDGGSNLLHPTLTEDRSRGYRTAIITIIACWVLAALGPLSLIFPLVAVAVLLQLISQRKLWAAFLLTIATPLFVSAVWAVPDYARGTAKMRTMGPISLNYYNPHPQVRCGYLSGGCFSTGNEWLTIVPYNFMLTGIATMFGPMPGTYAGAYPDENQAKSALQHAISLSSKELAEDVLKVGDATVQLDQGVGSQLLKEMFYDHDRFYGWHPKAKIGAVLYKEDCVILRIPQPYSDTSETSALIVLVDREKGRPFAYYAEGRCYFSHHPVPYQRQAL